MTMCIYLILKHMCFPGMGNLAWAAELLSQAEWAALKSSDHAVHQRLHRCLGRLHTVTGNLEAALFNFANDVSVISNTLTTMALVHAYCLSLRMLEILTIYECTL